jgi:hypothetical protein
LLESTQSLRSSTVMGFCDINQFLPWFYGLSMCL